MKELLEYLKKHHLTIGSVESMTGGLFASELASISGASACFKGSLVTYVIEEKESLAFVKKETIDKYSVVSTQVAKEMAIGGKKRLNVDVCVSVTGNAGPTSDIGDKPVGEIHIAVAFLDKIFSKDINLNGERNHIRSMCVVEMASFVLNSLKDWLE